MEEVKDSPDFWSGLVQSYNSPIEHSFLIDTLNKKSLNGQGNSIVTEKEKKLSGSLFYWVIQKIFLESVSGPVH